MVTYVLEFEQNIEHIHAAKNSKYTFVMDHFDSLWFRLFKRHFGRAMK